jgi:hypothetical protein
MLSVPVIEGVASRCRAGIADVITVVVGAVAGFGERDTIGGYPPLTGDRR